MILDNDEELYFHQIDDLPRQMVEAISKVFSEEQLLMFRFLKYENIPELSIKHIVNLIDDLKRHLNSFNSLVKYTERCISELDDLKNDCIALSKSNPNKTICSD